jgi:hypothetical protein
MRNFEGRDIFLKRFHFVLFGSTPSPTQYTARMDAILPTTITMHRKEIAFVPE